MNFNDATSSSRPIAVITKKCIRPLYLLYLLPQIQRYENGSVQPTLNVLRRLAIALSVSADLLVFDKDERGPDADLVLEFEALSQFDAQEKEVARKVLQGLIIQHQAERWSSKAG